MQELLSNLLIAVITAAVPVITAYGISLIKKTAENAAANTSNVKEQGYIREIADAISDAVAATSQTYVDALRRPAYLRKRRRKKLQKSPLRPALHLSARRHRRS